MDFGLARQMNSTDQAQITHSGAIPDALVYVPRAGAGEDRRSAAASDVYALERSCINCWRAGSRSRDR